MDRWQRRRLYARVVQILIWVGILCAAIPFWRAIPHRLNASAEVLRTELAGLTPGKFRWVDSSATRYSHRFLVMREGNGVLHAYEVPYSQGAYALPVNRWWQVGVMCQDFGPDTDNGQLSAIGLIRCHDAKYESEVAWQWTYQGRSEKDKPDLLTVPFHVDGSWLILERD